MSNVTKYQRQDLYETTLAQDVDSSSTSISVVTAPSFTLSSGSFYIGIDSDNSTKYEVCEVTGVSGTTLTVVRGIDTYEGESASGQAHSAGAKVVISNHWIAFDHIKDAVNSKLDQDGGNTSTAFDLDLSGSNFRIRKDGNDMKFTDDNQAEITLSSLASLSGVNDKVKISSNDTTEDYLINKIVGGDGIATPTEVNDGSDEDLSLAIDLATNPGLEFSSGQLQAKAGTGITVTSGGINVDSGTTSGKVIVANGSDEIEQSLLPSGARTQFYQFHNDNGNSPTFDNDQYGIPAADGVLTTMYANFYIEDNFSTASVKVVWSCDTASGNLYYQGNYYYAADNESPATGNIAATAVATSGNGTWDFLDIGALSGPTGGDLVTFRFYRQGGDANDTLSAAADFFGIIVTFS